MIEQPHPESSNGNQPPLGQVQLRTPDRNNPNYMRVGWINNQLGSEVNLGKLNVDFGIGEVNNAKDRNISGRAAFRLADGNVYYVEAGMIICVNETIQHGTALGGFLVEAPQAVIGEPVKIITRDTRGTVQTFTSPTAVQEAAIELPQLVAVKPGETQPNSENMFTQAEAALESVELSVPAILVENWNAIGGNTGYLTPAT